MEEPLLFETRDAFRRWLSECDSSDEGVWLLFGKPRGPKTLKAGEALEEALCFGWIDGQMRSIDAVQYMKYFSPRRLGSHWSSKNKALADELEKRGLMTDAGRRSIAEAKANGRWDAPERTDVTPEQIDALGEILRAHDAAYVNFIAMSPSIKKTYARGYYDAKTEDGRDKRLAWMVDRLERNLKPM